LVWFVNNVVTRDYYSHDVVVVIFVIFYIESQLDEFGGVSNWYSECVDCYNSHKVMVMDVCDSV